MADDRGVYNELLKEIGEVIKDEFENYLQQLRSDIQRLDNNLESYRSEVNELRERFHDLQHDMRRERYSRRYISERDRRNVRRLFRAGMHCKGNSATDPDYEHFTLDDLPDV